MRYPTLDKTVLIPVEYPNLIRLGPKGDGGYVVPGDQIKDCSLLVSLGLSDNWDFDREFLAMNPAAKVIGVDHTIGSLWILRRILVYSWKVLLYTLILDRRKRSKYVAKVRNHFGYFSFFREPHVHLKKRASSRTGQLDISLGQILETNPALGTRHDVFLKMDIEGAEYDVSRDIIRCQDRIRCIAAEFHDLGERTEEFNVCMQALSSHFFVVHVHGNNGASYDLKNDFPSTVEMTFVNRALFDKGFLLSAREYPRIELDFPNDPNAPEYGLHFE